jgi:hypothetical protein
MKNQNLSVSDLVRRGVDALLARPSGVQGYYLHSPSGYRPHVSKGNILVRLRARPYVSVKRIV